MSSLALKLLSSLALLPRTKVCHFCCSVCRQKRTCKKQERNWSTFFKSFGKFSISRVQWHPQEKMSFESNKTLALFSVPVFCPHFFLTLLRDLRFMISFIIDMKPLFCYCCCTNICVFRIAVIWKLTIGNFSFQVQVR